MYFLIGFSAAAAIISFTVRSIDPTIGRQTAIAAAAAAMLSLIGTLGGVFDEIASLAELGGIGSDAIKFVLKAVGIAYITRISASLCTDVGESTLAKTAELAGRLTLVLMTIPIARKIVEFMIEILNSAI